MKTYNHTIQKSRLILSKAELIPGSIFLLMDEPSKTTWKHKLIVSGQSLVPFSRGNAALVHAIICCQNRGDFGEPEIAEASGTGIVRTTKLRPGLYYIYSPYNSLVGNWAAQIAMMWAIDGNIKYNKPSSVLSIIHSKSYQKNASLRANLYAKVAFSNAPEWGESGSFCSQFVTASYQAAYKKMVIDFSELTATDALHCSVRSLHDNLISDKNFFLVGAFRYDEKISKTNLIRDY